jgi:DNA-binding HxlR family transcriptional regulator
MKNSVFKSQLCSVARSLEVIGEWWTLLIVREAFFGVRRFNEFQRKLGIARNVLSERLTKLVEAGIMERHAASGRGNPVDYELTEMGQDLFPVVVSIMQWGDRWISGPGSEPVTLIERESGEVIGRVHVLGVHGKPLRLDGIRIVSGPGASGAVQKRFG